MLLPLRLNLQADKQLTQAYPKEIGTGVGCNGS